VRFLGFITHEEKLTELRRAWLHVLTSPKEGWGIANLEAAACATPTVASDAPGLRESVVDGETGLLVPHGDVDALTEAIGGLIDDHARREAMGRAARRYAERFSWDASADALERLLGEVVAGSGLD
jgi:glycosyltransferase involved in cell wall biosynthesis